MARAKHSSAFYRPIESIRPWLVVGWFLVLPNTIVAVRQCHSSMRSYARFDDGDGSGMGHVEFARRVSACIIASGYLHSFVVDGGLGMLPCGYKHCGGHSGGKK